VKAEILWVWRKDLKEEPVSIKEKKADANIYEDREIWALI